MKNIDRCSDRSANILIFSYRDTNKGWSNSFHGISAIVCFCRISFTPFLGLSPRASSPWIDSSYLLLSFNFNFYVFLLPLVYQILLSNPILPHLTCPPWTQRPTYQHELAEPKCHGGWRPANPMETSYFLTIIKYEIFAVVATSSF